MDYVINLSSRGSKARVKYFRYLRNFETLNLNNYFGFQVCLSVPWVCLSIHQLLPQTILVESKVVKLQGLENY